MTLLPIARDTETKPTVRLKPNEDRRVRRGHLWVFSNEIEKAPDTLDPGGLVQFLTARQELLGVGFYNARSLIAGRVLDRRATEIDVDFFANRLRRAKEMRDRLDLGGAYRWVFGESDDLPGLVIDRYDDVVVLESYCAGMDQLMPLIIEAVETFGPWKAVVLRNDAAARRLEQLPESVAVVKGTLEGLHDFTTDGIKASADLVTGQKTGFFFDQRHNRAAVAALAKDQTVLDVFCHTGGFGLWCARAGAAKVVGVDDSAAALEIAQRNTDQNGWTSKMSFVKSDAFAYLSSNKETHGIVILDPPRFAPSKKNVPEAIKAYVRLNAQGLRRVSGGGFLATSSCSQHITRDDFRQILARAVHDSGRRAVILRTDGAGPDHPVRPAMPETEYLKFALLQVT